MIENEPPRAGMQKPNVSHSIDTKHRSSFDSSVIQGQSMLNSKYELLSGYLDGELTQQEAQKINLLLENDSEYKQLHDEMAAMRYEVQSLSLQQSELEHLDRLFQEPVAKTTRLFGFALLTMASLILVGFILYSVFINAAVSLLVKFAIGLLGVGSLALLYGVLRQRMINDKKDKYNRVKI